MRGLHAAVVAGCMAACAAGIAHAQVFVRGQEAPASGAVLSIDAAGVFVSEGGGEDGKGKATKIVSWDRVREVRGEQSGPAAAFTAMADDLWRARTRIERGDYAAAEPLLEGVASTARAGKSAIGPTGAVLEEGLLRCRLHRGAQASAVFPYLRWRAVQESAQVTGTRGAWIGGTFDAPSIFDSKTQLCPGLPPVFLDDAAVMTMAASVEWEGVSSGELGAWYRAAAVFETSGGRESALPADPSVVGQREDVRFVADVVLARAGNAEQRAAARASLISRLAAPDLAPWAEAWCRVGIGRSLLLEQGVDDQRRGVLHLLHVPARLSRTSPYLASVALAESARAIMKMGDATGASMVKAELVDRYPRRSASSWTGLAEIRVNPEAGAGREVK